MIGLCPKKLIYEQFINGKLTESTNLSNSQLSNMVYCKVPAVPPQDHVVIWKLWLPAAAQNPDRVSYHIQLAPEKIKIKNSKYSLY